MPLACCALCTLLCLLLLRGCHCVRTVQASGAEGWWKLREACLLAAGALADRLLEAREANRQAGGGLLHDTAREGAVTAGSFCRSPLQ